MTSIEMVKPIESSNKILLKKFKREFETHGLDILEGKEKFNNEQYVLLMDRLGFTSN